MSFDCDQISTGIESTLLFEIRELRQEEKFVQANCVQRPSRTRSDPPIWVLVSLTGEGWALLGLKPFILPRPDGLAALYLRFRTTNAELGIFHRYIVTVFVLCRR